MGNIFDNEAAAVRQLMKDKHTLLEGYVTEQLFQLQFLLNSDTPFSGGWWMTEHNQTRFFFIVKEQLTGFDQELIKMIPPRHQCWQVYLNGDGFVFLRDQEVLTQEGFLNKFELKIIRKPMVAEGYTRNTTRQQKAIAFFKKTGILKKIAVERLFANNFLTVYFNRMINIDFLTKSGDKLNIVEVKFKYESHDGYIGINTGQMEMFRFFMSLDFNIYHYILYNHTKDKNISIFGFLELPEVKNWHYTKINDATIDGVGIAPPDTSVSGGFSQPYYKIPFKGIEGKIPLEIKVR